MRVLRASGENISPSDDASLFQNILNNGLFEDCAISSLGSNQVSIGALYGILQGREFTNSATTLTVTLPSGADTKGYIYVEIDLNANPIGSLKSALDPFTPTLEEINGTGTVAQYVIATYEASAVAVTSITPTYEIASLHGSRYEADIAIASTDWNQDMYTITDVHIDPNKLIILSYDPTISDAEYEAFEDANIRPYGTIQSGSMQVKAVGGAPSMALTIVLIVRN